MDKIRQKEDKSFRFPVRLDLLGKDIRNMKTPKICKCIFKIIKLYVMKRVNITVRLGRITIYCWLSYTVEEVRVRL